VHVLADNGTTVETEIEAFGFIARASDDPDAFALPAMVTNLFETGAVMGIAGISDVAPRHLSRPGMPARLATHPAAARLSRRQRLLRGGFSKGHDVTRASEAGMTAKPGDPTTTAQGEGR
jgi:hypothetical protein